MRPIFCGVCGVERSPMSVVGVEAKRRETSGHRGSSAIDWVKGSVITGAEAAQDVGHELWHGLHLQPPDSITTPHRGTPQDALLLSAMLADPRRGNPSGEPQRIFAVAMELSVPQAADIARMMRKQYGDGFRGIGCGTLRVPPSFAEERSIFPDTAWQKAMSLPDGFFIPLYRCITEVGQQVTVSPNGGKPQIMTPGDEYHIDGIAATYYVGPDGNIWSSGPSYFNKQLAEQRSMRSPRVTVGLTGDGYETVVFTYQDRHMAQESAVAAET